MEEETRATLAAKRCSVVSPSYSAHAAKRELSLVVLARGWLSHGRLR